MNEKGSSSAIGSPSFLVVAQDVINSSDMVSIISRIAKRFTFIFPHTCNAYGSLSFLIISTILYSDP
jgi:hypothetical protein